MSEQEVVALECLRQAQTALASRPGGATRSRPDGNDSAGSAPEASDAYTSLPRRRLRGNGSYGRLGKRELTRSLIRIGSEYDETKHAFDPNKDTHDPQDSADKLEILSETFVTTVKRGTQQHLRTAARRRAQLNGFERQVYENAIPGNVSNEDLATVRGRSHTAREHQQYVPNPRYSE